MNRKVNLHLICHPAHMLQKLLPATVAAKSGTHKNRKTIANYGRAVSWLPCLPNQHPKTQTQTQKTHPGSHDHQHPQTTLETMEKRKRKQSKSGKLDRKKLRGGTGQQEKLCGKSLLRS